MEGPAIAPLGSAVGAAPRWGESQRKAWLDAARRLDDGGDPSEALAFWRANEALCVDAVGAIPGDDRVRAALLRLLPAAVPDEQAREALIDAARRALNAYADGADDPTHTLRRPPAWFGLCVLELAGIEGRAPHAALADAIAATREAFAGKLGDGQPLGDGELLWALAEQAEAAGWQATSDHLIDLAAAAPFEDPALRAQVQLLVCWRLCEADDARVDPMLASLHHNEDAGVEVRVQALWMSALRAEADAPESAIRLLDEALVLVDPAADAEVAAQLQARRASLCAR